MDARGFVTPTAPLTETPSHDLSTERGRLLYLRDVTVPDIPLGELDLTVVACGTAACLCGWAMRDQNLRNAGIGGDYMDVALGGGFFGLSVEQGGHLFLASHYKSKTPTHAELRAHIDDVLEGRVR